MPWETIVYKRDELYEAVWSEPVRQVAQRNNISDVALAKICRKLNVPLPGRGYWARKAAGQALKRIRLPALKQGELAQHCVNRWRDPVQDAEPSADVQEQLAREKQDDQRIAVPEQLVEPHRFIRLSLPILKKGKLGTTLSERRCLHVSVSEAALDRALRIMDALLKSLEARGFELVLTEPDRPQPNDSYDRRERSPSRTGVKIGESLVHFGLWEHEDTVKIPPPPPPKRQSKWNPPPSLFPPRPEYEHRPNGKLTLSIVDVYTHHHGGRLSWSDGKVQRLEERLNDFVAALIMTAERMRLARLEAEEQERRRQEEARRRKEAEERARLEQQLVYDLDSRLTDCIYARNIRQFVDMVEADMRTRGSEMDPASDLGRWMAWARGRAEALQNSAVRSILQLRTPPRERMPWER